MSKVLQAKKIAQLTGHNASIFAICPDTQENYFFSGAGDGWIVRWNFDEPELGKLVAKVETQIFALKHLPKWNKIVAGNMNGGVHWVDLANPDDTKNIAHHKMGVFDMLLIDDYLFTAGGAGMLTKWSATESRSLESFQLSNQSLRCLDYHQGRNEIAVGASDNSIYLLDATSLELKKTIPNAHDNSVFSVRYAPGGSFLYSGGRDALLKVWDISLDFVSVSSQPAHWYTINDIAFHPDGHWLATGSRDKTIKIWDANTFELLKVIETIRDKGHVNSVNKLFWSSHHNYLLSGSDDRSMIIWEIKDDFQTSL